MILVNEKRDIELITDYINGKCLTYQELGKKYNITRERARQLLNKYLEPYQLSEIRKENHSKRTIMIKQNNIIGKCKYCGKPKNKKRIYCSMECFINDIKSGPGVRKEKMRGYVRKYIAKNKDTIYLKNRIWYYKKRINVVDYNDDRIDDYIEKINKLTNELNKLVAKKRKGTKK